MFLYLDEWRVQMSAEDREIIKKIKEYAKNKGKKFQDVDFCTMTSATREDEKSMSDRTLYRKLDNDKSFIDFEYLVKIYKEMGDGKNLWFYTYLKDFFKDVLLEEQNAKEIDEFIRCRKNIMDCLDFMVCSSPILFISMYSKQIADNIEDILNASTQQNSILKELNICVNEIEGSDYENRDVIFNKIRKWRDDTENQTGELYIRMIFRDYNVPSTVAGLVDGKLISFVRDGEEFLKLSEIGKKLIIDDVVQIMSPKFSERLLSEHDDVTDYDDVNNVDNPAIKLTDF